MIKRLMQSILAIALLCMTAPTAATEELPFPFTIEGPWWMQMAGNRGTLKIDFGPIFAGDAVVTGAGMSKDFETAFVISEDVEQRVRFDSRRQLRGEIALQDIDRIGDTGTLTITGGTLNGTKLRMRLKGELQLPGKPARKIRMRGERLPGTPADMQGRTTDGRLRGTGIRSNKNDLTLLNHQTLGFPFFDLISAGPARVDGAEVDDVVVVGLICLAPNGKVLADMTDGPGSDLVMGDGFGKGRITENDPKFGRPRLLLSGSFENRRRVRCNGILLQIQGR